jgi:hypothetical protein
MAVLSRKTAPGGGGKLDAGNQPENHAVDVVAGSAWKAKGGFVALLLLAGCSMPPAQTTDVESLGLKCEQVKGRKECH